jgi:Rrf2 family nitric oxide-sensitive transcriptional repressor
LASFLNKASQYGLYALVSMARDRETWVTAGGVAKDFAISQNHVAKILQQLARAGLIHSVRGLGGGYQLAREPAVITMLEVVECLDGPLNHPCSACTLRGTARCGEVNVACAVHNVLAELDEMAYFTLKSITLATLARSLAGPGLPQSTRAA